MPVNAKFYKRCHRARELILDSDRLKDIYVGIFRSVEERPNFYASTHHLWMEEYISKDLWFVDPIVKNGVILPKDNDRFFSWFSELSDSEFLTYRDSFVKTVKGFSKVFKYDLPEGVETRIIGIGLYSHHLSSDASLNISEIFEEIESKMQRFVENELS